MIRRLDRNDDWTFGSGLGGFATGLEGLSLRIRMQLREWVGNCFFALQRGINWHLAEKNTQRITMEINASIMRNPEVLGIKSIDFERAENRVWIPKIQLMTIYGEANI